MKQKYKISDLIISCDFNNSVYWDKFKINSTTIEDIKIDNIDKVQLRYELSYFNIPSNYSKCFQYSSEIMLVDNEWKNILLFPLKNELSRETLILQVFYANAVKHHMIQMHSSLVEYKGKGIMFLGPSGIGKTTQAELWNKYLDALIVNGDIVYVEDRDNEFIGWGTPWHGSSPYCENTSVPIKALIILKQGNENKIRKLEGLEMLSEVEKQLFYPEWVDGGIELALDTLDHLLRNVPVYELTNKADKESVELVKQVIFIDEKN